MPASADPLNNPAFRAPGLRERLRQYLQGATRPLDCLQVEVTSVCSGRCLYCPHTTRAAVWNSRHMKDEAYAALWPLLRRSSRVHLQGWGEPLLHPRFFDYVALARRAGCRVSTTSCGLVMNADVARRLVASGMDMVAFSLVGTDPESNAARAGVPFEKVKRAVALVNEALAAAPAKKGEPPLAVHFAYLLLADRVGAVIRLPELMKEWDVRMAVVSTLDYIADEGQEGLAFLPQDKAKIAAARAVLEEVAARARADGRCIFHELPDDARSRSVAGGCRENVARSAYVDAEGLLSPCVYLNVPVRGEQPRRRVFGSVLEEDPWVLWAGEDGRRFRERLGSGQPEACCLPCPKRFEG